MKKLLYDKAAENWNYALPLGNGRIGAMMYGGVATDMIRLNGDTLWSGQPDKEKRLHDIKSLSNIRNLIDEGKLVEAEKKTLRVCLTLYLRHICPVLIFLLKLNHK